MDYTRLDEGQIGQLADIFGTGLTQAEVDEIAPQVLAIFADFDFLREVELVDETEMAITLTTRGR